MGRACSLLLALIVVAAPSARADESAFMTLLINTVGAGEKLVVMRPEDLLVEPSALLDAGMHFTGGRRERIDGKEFVSLASLAPLVRYRLDEQELLVRISAHPTLFGTAEFNLRPAAPKDIVFHPDTSAFANYSLRLQDFSRLTGFAEAGVNYHGALVYSGLNLNATSWVPVRGLTNVTYDDRERLDRWVFGDSFVSTGTLGGGAFLGGISLTRTFEVDPYYSRYPTFGYSGAVVNPSTLDIYVNNVLVRRESVAPGTFKISDLPVTVGSGTTRYVLRDAFGNQTEIGGTYYMSSGILRRGTQDYSYAVGFPRNHLATSSFDYDSEGLAFVGRHRWGLRDWLTVGARLEASLHAASGGAQMAVLTPAGEFDAAVAASAEAGGKGLSSLLSYSYIGRRAGLSLRVATTSDHYSTLSMPAAIDRPLVQASLQASVPIGSVASIVASAALGKMRDATVVGDRYTVSATVRLVNQLSLFLSGDVYRESGALGWDAFAALNFSLGGGISGSVGWQQRNDKGDALVQLQNPLTKTTGASYEFQGMVGQDAPVASGRFQYQAGFGRYSADYQLIDGKLFTGFEASGGIVAVAGGGVHATRAVSDSFGVIQVPGVKGVRGYLNNQDMGRTDSSGNLVVPSLLSYYGNRLSVNDSDIPLDREVDFGEQVVATALRGGALVTFTARRTLYVRGVIVVLDEAGASAAPTYGELTIIGGKQSIVSPLGRAGEFEYENVTPGRYAARVEWSGGHCDFELTLPDEAGGVRDLGEQRCTIAGRLPAGPVEPGAARPPTPPAPPEEPMVGPPAPATLIAPAAPATPIAPAAQAMPIAPAAPAMPIATAAPATPIAPAAPAIPIAPPTPPVPPVLPTPVPSMPSTAPAPVPSVPAPPPAQPPTRAETRPTEAPVVLTAASAPALACRAADSLPATSTAAAAVSTATAMTPVASVPAASGCGVSPPPVALYSPPAPNAVPYSPAWPARSSCGAPAPMPSSPPPAAAPEAAPDVPPEAAPVCVAPRPSGCGADAPRGSD